MMMVMTMTMTTSTSRLASSCPRLVYVSLSLCSTVKDITLNKLGQNCPDLAFLNLFGCSYLSEKAGVNILDRAGPLA